MKPKIVLFSIVFVLSVLAGVSYFVSAEQKSADIPRWDLRMIEEAPIWRNLLVQYPLRTKHWPESKAALQTIVNKFPDSQWADDAALILAWGKFSFEKDSAGAIEALRKVMEKYPDGKTVVGFYMGTESYSFDNTWLRWSGHLWDGRTASLNPDGTIRIFRPFDRYGTIPRQEREVLFYFDHLEKYPRFTRDMAQSYIVQIFGIQGNMPGAIGELEAIIARHPDLAAVNAADREAAAKPDGYPIGNEFGISEEPIWRPEYKAYLSLMAAYQGQGQHDKAVAAGLKLADICSPDGWRWTINRRIGDLLAKSNRWVEAEQQYQLALKGYRQVVADRVARQKMSVEEGLVANPPDFVSWEDEILRKWGWNGTIVVLEKLIQEAQAKH